ncbi:hypothetical protein J1N35_044173 [Gossypium stocksii]|uniref:Uncharacterized protein n=1 Tax=Gossypium stocksii TaxID=47602 RepID=A0A9D3ZFJ9_9ROSI|nr:hypothetical protein J1N35_044173 [Gossypium stocksii]
MIKFVIVIASCHKWRPFSVDFSNMNDLLDRNTSQQSWQSVTRPQSENLYHGLLILGVWEVLKSTRTQLERELLMDDVLQIEDMPSYTLLC